MEHPVLGGPVPFGGQQAGPVGLRNAPPEQEDVGFLARLQDAQLGVDGGQLGDQPLRIRLRAAFGRDRLIPGGPAVAFWQAVGRVEALDARQSPAPADAFGRGRFVVLETLLTAAVAGFSVVCGGKFVHG
jgi:hypothetical protein